MKTLPDNPDLDHLRAQAKDLLAGLRDTTGSTSLAQAQAALARLYGFPTWPALKAEVDRRQDSAERADADLTRRLAERFDLGTPVEPMRSVARENHIGREWILRTERGRWLLHACDQAIWTVPPATSVRLQRAAIDAGVRLPAPVLGRTGAIVEELDGHRWRAYESVDDGRPLAAPVSARIARQVGEILASLHGLALPVDRISPWHARRLSDESWDEVAARVAASGAPWADLMAAAAPRLAELGRVGEGVPPPAPVLTHNTFGPGQARLAPDGRLVVVGWDNAGGQPPAWELAGALTDWAYGNERAVRALIEGYRARAGSVPELELASFRGSVNSYGNYVHEQIGLALDARDPEDRRFTERNVRHLLGPLPTRSDLERVLDVARAA